MNVLSILIESPANQTVKLAASLFEKKGRDRSGLFALEGERFVAELLAPQQNSGFRIRFFMASESFAAKKEIEAYDAVAETYIVRDDVFRRISDVETPQGILAVCEQQQHAPEDLLNRENPLLLILEEMQDPGNLGTALRLADAANADGVILSAGSADVYNPKALRAAAGSALRVPFAAGCDLATVLPMLQARGVRVYAAMPHATTFPYAHDLTKGTAFMIGNEARGLSAEAAALADAQISLPMPGNAESLNAAMACGILVYEAVRQRVR